jgi:hypothetical protein
MAKQHKIPDFTDAERWVIQSTLKERYGQEILLAEAEIEYNLGPNASELPWCPAVFWTAEGANFVIVKLGDQRYHAVFYYTTDKQYGTGIDSYDDIAECVVTLLQVQADHDRKRDMTFNEKTEKATKDKKPDSDSDDNYSPLFWGD